MGGEVWKWMESRKKEDLFGCFELYKKWHKDGVDAVGGEGRGGMWGFIKGPGTWGQTKVNL